MFATALQQTVRAFTGDGNSVDHAVEHLRAYYDPQGAYAGATFSEVRPRPADEVTAADLWAVSTLSMTIPAGAGRALMSPGRLRSIVERQLQMLPPSLRLEHVTSSDLWEMWRLHDSVRSGVPPLGSGSSPVGWCSSVGA